MTLTFVATTALSIGFNYLAAVFAPKPKRPDINRNIPQSKYGSPIPIPINLNRIEVNKHLFRENIYDVRRRRRSRKGGSRSERQPLGSFGGLIAQEPTDIQSVIINGTKHDVNSDFFQEYITFFDGTQTQPWSVAIEKAQEINRPIVYKNQAYLGFNRLPLNNYGGLIPAQIAALCYNRELGLNPRLDRVIEFICRRADIDLSLIDASELASVTMTASYLLIEDGEGYRKAIEDLMQFYLFVPIERNGQLVFKFINRDTEPVKNLGLGDYIVDDNFKFYKRKPQDFIEFAQKYWIKFKSIDRDFLDDAVSFPTNQGSKQKDETIEFNISAYQDEIKQRGWLYIRYLLDTSSILYDLTLTAEAVARLNLEELDKVLLTNGEVVQVTRIDKRDDYSVAIEARRYLSNLNYDESFTVPSDVGTAPTFNDPPDANIYVVETTQWNSQPLNTLYFFADNPCTIEIGTSNTNFSQDVIHERQSTIANVINTVPQVSGEILDSGDTIDIEVETGLFEGIGNFNTPAFRDGQINLALLAKQSTSGAWVGEFIQFGASTALENNQYRLTQINRGLYNSAIVRNNNGVTTQEKLFLFNDADGLAYYSQKTGDYGFANSTLYFRAIVKTWQNLALTPIITVTPQGLAYKPLAVTNLASQQDENGSVRITWDFTPPTTNQVTGQENVTYSIDIVNGSTVVRTIDVNQKEVIYLAGDRTTDGVGFPFEARVYAVSSLVGRGDEASLTINEDANPEPIVFINNTNNTGIKGIRYINGTTDPAQPVTYTVTQNDNNFLLIVRNATAEAYTNIQFSAGLSIGFEVYVLNQPTNPIVARVKILVPTFLPIPYLSDINTGATAIVTHVGEGQYSSIGNFQPIVSGNGTAVTTLKNPNFVSSDSSVNIGVTEPNAETTEVNLTVTGTPFSRRTIQDDGVDVPNQNKLNFVNAVLTDDTLAGATNVEFIETAVDTIVLNIPTLDANQTITIDQANFPRKGVAAKISSTSPVRVRLSVNNQARSDDLSRSIETRLSQITWHGVYFDWFTDAPPDNTAYFPPAPFYNDDGVGYFTVTDRSGANQTNVTITITYG